MEIPLEALIIGIVGLVIALPTTVSALRGLLDRQRTHQADLGELKFTHSVFNDLTQRIQSQLSQIYNSNFIPQKLPRAPKVEKASIPIFL